jgi:hypothetical protein
MLLIIVLLTVLVASATEIILAIQVINKPVFVNINKKTARLTRKTSNRSKTLYKAALSYLIEEVEFKKLERVSSLKYHRDDIRREARLRSKRDFSLRKFLDSQLIFQCDINYSELKSQIKGDAEMAEMEAEEAFKVHLEIEEAKKTAESLKIRHERNNQKRRQFLRNQELAGRLRNRLKREEIAERQLNLNISKLLKEENIKKTYNARKSRILLRKEFFSFVHKGDFALLNLNKKTVEVLSSKYQMPVPVVLGMGNKYNIGRKNYRVVTGVAA